MNDPIEPIRHKMTEAIPDPAKAAANPQSQAPGDNQDSPHKADLKSHNAAVQPGVKDHMVDIGRGEQTKGRGDK